MRIELLVLVGLCAWASAEVHAQQAGDSTKQRPACVWRDSALRSGGPSVGVPPSDYTVQSPLTFGASTRPDARRATYA